MLGFRLTALGAALVVSTAASTTGGVSSNRLWNHRDVPFNEYGLPVRDRSGNPINYSRGQLGGRARLEPARTGAATSGPPFDASAFRFYAAFGSGIGKSNIVVADNGGRKEVYLGGSTSTFGPDDYWYALAYEPATGGYEQVFVSPYLANSFGIIARIEMADVDPNPGMEILVALDDGRIEVYAVADKKWLREIVTAASDLDGLAVADVDGDSTSEIIVCTRFPTSNLYVYAASGALEWQVAGVGGNDVVVAQMDADAALEIAVTDGSIVDAATHSVQWKRADGFGLHLGSADIDGDGMAELIVAEAWSFVRAYDVDQQFLKWSISTPQDIGAIHVTDIDADGVQELLVGDGQWGSIRAFDTVTQQLEWQVNNPEHGVTDIAAADVDADGKNELLWGAGASSSGADYFYVVDWTTKQFEWQNVHLDGPFVGPERADLDGDGSPEIVAASWKSKSDYDSGRILVFDGRTFALRGMSAPIADNFAWTGLHDLRLRDVDGDGRAEILVAADRLYDGIVEIYGFDASNTFTLKWTNTTRPYGAPFYSVEAADVDGDGQMEIVAGNGQAHSGAEGIFVYVYDYATRSEEWHSPQVGGSWAPITGLQVGDTDGDGTLDIAGMVKGGDTYIFDGPTKQLEAILPGQGTALRLYGTAPVNIMVGDVNGDIAASQYRQGSYREVYRRNLVAKPVDGFTIGADRTLWLGSDGTLRAMTLDGTILWESARYGTVFGERTLPWSATGGFLSAGSYAIIGFQRR
jgi:VCBS repeat protein